MPLLTLLLSGCWSTDLSTTDFRVVPYENPDLFSDEVVIEKVTTGLECPDGEEAVFYAVYNEGATEPGPVAVLLHSSSFDYVIYPKNEGELAGAHYAPDDVVQRMSADWGIRKVWETLGVYRQIEATEVNEGAVPAQLVNNGFVVLMPINCWGDLWHNDETQPNDVSSEFIDRYGRTFSYWMIRVIEEGKPSFITDAEIGFVDKMDATDIHLVGLGDGARGVIDLLRHDDLPTIQSILVDSPIDDLNDWQSEVSGVEEGIDRIFYDRETDPGLSHWSLESLAQEGALDDIRVALVYSDVDPRVPSGNLDDTIAALPEDACVHNTNSAAHVFTNSNSSLTGDIVDYMLTGAGGSSCNPGGGNTGGNTGGTTGGTTTDTGG